MLREQSEIMREVHKMQAEVKGKGYHWNRYRGDCTVRIVAHYLRSHLPKGFKLAFSAYVEEVPNEFDILIVDGGADPVKFTNAYPRDQVHAVIEVKAAGVYYKHSEIEQKLRQQFGTLEDLTEKPVIYLTVYEGHKATEKTYRALGKKNSFVLQIGRKEAPNPREWKRFIARVNEILRSK